MRFNIFDVAKKSGLSVVTVSRVLNDSPTVREKNRKKVLDAIKELGYRPNSAARSLARGKTGIIGLTLTTLQDSLFDNIVKAVNEALEEYGYFLAISIKGQSVRDDGNTDHFLFQKDRVDGIIVLSPTDEDEYVFELKRKGIPFVLVDNQNPAAQASTVNVDNYQGGRDATEHLLKLGHKKIVHIAGPELFLSSRERKRGYSDAMTAAGLTPMIEQAAQFSIRDGYAAVARWLTVGELPSAVFAADDFIALGVFEGLRNEGIRVPEDVSIVGYDDQMFAGEVRPGFTTVRQPAERMGREAVSLLMKGLNGASKRTAAVQLPPQLIVRGSTSAPRDV
ncbi:LacI family DNA-binding transcriptional regulator [Paenibacillus thermoaerophilus]|uniref:LacI family DNA-binding transcriptional regulator n=1 Tax=Paenibacillus thermoaerophilus TaxID=1215385 RepID=A0ABW2V7P6_9BACL|nr:LacI family DNA-binding transcriptional regulator [Paenibacillus thermoaerophilus]TMV17943.1 LacI family transcriptional regulator [Paenibacillus thermoaerophilus]